MIGTVSDRTNVDMCFIEQTDITTGKSMTYVELATNIRKIASALNRRGLRANQPILVMASNHIELPVFLLGTWRAGGSFAALTINYSSGAPVIAECRLQV